MDWRWNWIGTLLWNLVVHAVTLQWGSLPGDIDAIKDWFRSFWGEIENRVSDVRNWARGQISWLSGYAFGLYVQAVNWINDQIASVRGWVDSKFGHLWSVFWGKVNDLYAYAYGRYTAAVSWARNKANAVQAYLESVIYYWRDWLRDRYEWIRSYRWLITEFLHGAKAAINWLWHTAWGALQNFLANPVGFVLGWLLDPIRNIVNWWRTYGPLLMNFVVNQLPNLLNLLATGFPLLMRFVNRPARTILELIADRFVNFAAGVLADEW